MCKETFGERLKKARKNAGYTQQQVMNILKISQTALSRYESDEREPSINTLKELSDLYEVSTDWLIGTKNSIINYENKDQSFTA